MPPDPKRVLFLCTGNYYRSRFAEAVFNHHARRVGLGWVADSAALADDPGRRNPGAISPLARAALAARGIPLPDPARPPRACLACDVGSADLVVALKRAEHRPYLLAKFPDAEARVVYWHVHDVDQAAADEALPQIDRLVGELVARYAGSRPAG